MNQDLTRHHGKNQKGKIREEIEEEENSMKSNKNRRSRGSEVRIQANKAQGNHQSQRKNPDQDQEVHRINRE